MKVLITTDWYKPAVNGVVTSVMGLSEQLRHRGHQVKILTLSETFRSYEEDDVIYMGSFGIGCIYPQARIKVPLSGKYFEKLAEWGPDIIHSQCEFSTFALARKLALKLGVPIVHTWHTIYEDYTHYLFLKGSFGKDIVRRMTRHISAQVDLIIAPSGKTQESLERAGTRCPVEVIPSGINIEKYGRYRTSGWRYRLRRQLGIHSDQTVLLYVGRLAKEKNIQELLRFQKAVSRMDTVLLIVGDGPYMTELREETRSLELEDRVIFTGMISPEQVGRYYQAGDLFVNGSVSETQGLTYAEALASGIPLLCRKDPCLDGVLYSGRNGWSYENQETFVRIVEKWCRLRAVEKEAFRRMAAQSAAGFSDAIFAGKVEEIYEYEREQKHWKAG